VIKKDINDLKSGKKMDVGERQLDGYNWLFWEVWMFKNIVVFPEIKPHAKLELHPKIEPHFGG